MRKSKRHHVDGKRSFRFHPMWMMMVFKLVRCLGPGTTQVWGPKYVELGVSPKELLPKGHVAVYVGESENEKQRVVVPVAHMNHPLLGKLLEKTERLYGFDHPGVITIPCGISEFQRVQKVIAAAQGYHHMPTHICCAIP